MEYNNLNWKDKDLNEKRTDMMACLIGFASILERGYKTIEFTENHLNYQKTYHHRIGYISSYECHELGDYLKYRMSQKLKDCIEKQLIDDEKKKIYELLNLIKLFDSQIELLSPINHPDKYATVNEKQIALLQKVIFDINELNSSYVIKEVTNNCNNLSKLSDIYVLKEKVNKQCEKQLNIIKTLQELN